jgi:endonuclease/exonuclease/phosphatase family metal-dependent hydrolase
MKNYSKGIGLAFLIGATALSGCKKTTSFPSSSYSSSDTNLLKIATFNIQNFGHSKLSKPEVVDTLANIVTNFGIVAIQEIEGNDVLEKFITKVNDKMEGSSLKYSYIQSAPLGGNQKERYGFIYDSSVICLSNAVSTDANNAFVRPPFIGYFKAGKFTFALATIHTQPRNATSEINALPNVRPNISEKDLIFLGDFNADGGYFCERKRKEWPGFSWIIPDSFDTTLANSENTYDRIVISDSTKKDYAGQVGVLRAFSSKQVSDHYPVWATFYRNKDSD